MIFHSYANYNSASYSSETIDSILNFLMISTCLKRCLPIQYRCCDETYWPCKHIFHRNNESVRGEDRPQAESNRAYQKCVQKASRPLNVLRRLR